MTTGEPPATSEAVARPARRPWWHRNLAPEERRRVMTELAMGRAEFWAWRFTAMLTLSVVVAVMGLSADSAAVVIGAMLLAPLMTPVLATAAFLSMSLIKRGLSSLGKVALATVWCVAIAFVLSRFLPDAPLPAEVLSRTTPDIRDLVVALAAGAAGSYATVRRDVSASLPGVAVAVALVPPLATMGMTLEAGKFDLAVGALLLYVTNLAAIVFAGVMVFIATGFVPPRRLVNSAQRLVVAAAVAFVVVVAVAVPLYGRSAEVVAAVRAEVRANEIVTAWLGESALTARVDVTGDRVLVRLEGFESPPDDALLTEALQAELGEVVVLVEWLRTERVTTSVTRALSEHEALLTEIEPVVDAWLVASDPAGFYERDDIDVSDDVVTVEVSGVGSPPSVDDLVARFEAELGRPLAVRLNWISREAITPTTVRPVDVLARRMEEETAAWAERRGLIVDSFGFDGDEVEVELIGPAEPDITDLVLDLQDLAGEEVPVRVLLTVQQVLTTPPPTTTVESTRGAEPTSIPTPTGSTESTPGG